MAMSGIGYAGILATREWFRTRITDLEDLPFQVNVSAKPGSESSESSDRTAKPLY